jgi:hypothetical protein
VVEGKPCAAGRRAGQSFRVMAIVLACAAPASAKAPKPADAATVEEMCVAARAAMDKERRGERDPDKEAIDRYRDKSRTPIGDWKRVVEIILDAKTEKLQPLRDDAVNALLERFPENAERDVQMRAHRRDVAQQLIELMKADPKKDRTGLDSIEKIITTWWRTQNNVEFKFHAKDSPSERKKSYDKLKKFLKENN